MSSKEIEEESSKMIREKLSDIFNDKEKAERIQNKIEQAIKLIDNIITALFNHNPQEALEAAKKYKQLMEDREIQEVMKRVFGGKNK